MRMPTNMFCFYNLYGVHIFIRADHRFYNLYGVYMFLFAGMFINSLFENTIFLFDDLKHCLRDNGASRHEEHMIALFPAIICCAYARRRRLS